MNVSSVTAQHVTNASGTVAIASSSTSIGATAITVGVAHDPILMENVANMVSTADMIALCSCVVLALSFMYNVYSTRKRRIIDEAEHSLRAKEYELELAKFKRETGEMK